MRVLVVGSGGREHALAWALSHSPLLTALFVAPGNPGTATIGRNVPIGALDIPALVDFAKAEAIDLVVPGPEAPLVAGLADALASAGIRCCGPSAAASALEGSKAFTKEICAAAGIPTALWEEFTDPDAAAAFIARRGAPLVIKADGLAAGKGVTVAATEAEAQEAASALLRDRALGEAGARILIEECLTGEEVSLFALCDGTDCILLGAAQDHKRVGDNDTGPNTGGMGAISPPARFPLPAQMAALDVFVRPVLREMAARGAPFTGILFAGLMLTEAGPKLIEYNVRLGDPETQALLPRLLGTDLLAAFLAAADGVLAHFSARWADVFSVAVVLAAPGYPGAYAKHIPIGGLDRAAAVPHAAIFHAGTEIRDGHLVSSGGRVLAVCATGASAASARESAYQAVREIAFPGAIYRSDIGARAL
jgi:phosphoribosylamine--glycine ligase